MTSAPYKLYSGEELKIAEKIQQRRYQLLVHSYIYYEMNKNIVSDNQWSKWAVELAELQDKYPELAKTVVYADDFEEWDGSTGAFLNFNDKPNIITTALRLLPKQTSVRPVPKKSIPLKKTKPAGRKLF